MPSSLPSITVAVPAYNHSRYVVQALDSTLESGVPEVEIIVCDDASTDDTAQLVEAWGRKHGHLFSRFELIRHERNAGLCQSLNDIVEIARGDLIHIIASDDYFLSGGLLTKTRVMAEHPEWQVAFCDGAAVGPENELYVESLVEASRLKIEQLVTGSMSEELLFHWGPPIHQMTWRRETYQHHGGSFAYESTVFCEDYDSALWAAAHDTLGYIPHVCQAYRCRSWPQTSDRNSIRELRDTAFVLTKHARLLEPRLRRQYELLARSLTFAAFGDMAAADALRRIHDASRETYIQRLRSPAGTCHDLEGPEPWEMLEEQLVRMEEVNHELKSLLRQTRELAKERNRTITDLTSKLKAAHHLLRYHAINPGRALRLWWSRNRLLP